MKEQQCMQLGKNEEVEVKVKEKIEAKNEQEEGREGWNLAGMGRRWGGVCWKGVDLVQINPRDVCIHPACFTFLSFTCTLKRI